MELVKNKLAEEESKTFLPVVLHFKKLEAAQPEQLGDVLRVVSNDLTLIYKNLVSQLVVLPLSGEHRPAHARSLPQKMGHMTSTLLVICRYTFSRTKTRESDNSLSLW